jgi:hypothetical protein
MTMGKSDAPTDEAEMAEVARIQACIERAPVPAPKGKNKLYANQGGCWFCSTDECDAFDTEWDTFVHIACLREVLAAEPEHPEAALMKYLLE